jgi:acyl carrier protein
VALISHVMTAPVHPGALPAPAPGIVAAPARVRRRAVDGTARGLPDRLTGLSPGERAEALSDAVRRATAAVFGHDAGTDLDLEQPFKDFGVDSLTAVELRNHVAGSTGLRLPPTVLFDCPTPAALAERLAEELEAEMSGASEIHRVLDRLAELLPALPDGGAHRDEVDARLRTLVRTPARASGTADDLSTATADEIFELLDSELETP